MEWWVVRDGRSVFFGESFDMFVTGYMNPPGRFCYNPINRSHSEENFDQPLSSEERNKRYRFFLKKSYILKKN